MKLIEQYCEFCNETGRYIAPDNVCEFCSGTGLTEEMEPTKIILKPGVYSGYQLRLEGEGSYDPHNYKLQRGDLVVEFHCEDTVEHANTIFTREGQNINAKVLLLESEIRNGCVR